MRQDLEAILSDVANVADRLIGWEAERHGVKRAAAREIVAREAGVTPGALERLQFGRLKFVDRIAGKLNDLLVRKIERRIAELEFELAALRASPGGISEADALAAATAVEEAKRLVRRG